MVLSVPTADATVSIFNAEFNCPNRQFNFLELIEYDGITICELTGNVIGAIVDVLTGGGGDPTPAIPDSDGDGITDDIDLCIFDPEIFNGFEDEDGCPDDVTGEIPTLDLLGGEGFPFEFNELTVVNDYVILDTVGAQPQVENLGIRWLGDEQIIISSITVGDSPFEIFFENIPLELGNNEIGVTGENLVYTIQEPARECSGTFSLDCIDTVTYEIPVVVSGTIGDKTVIAQGSITIDNSDRFNPYWLLLLILLVVPILGLVFWKRRRSRPTTKHLLKVTQSKPSSQVLVKREKSPKKGSARSKLKITSDNKSKGSIRDRLNQK